MEKKSVSNNKQKKVKAQNLKDVLKVSYTEAKFDLLLYAR